MRNAPNAPFPTYFGVVFRRVGRKSSTWHQKNKINTRRKKETLVSRSCHLRAIRSTCLTSVKNFRVDVGWGRAQHTPTFTLMLLRFFCSGFFTGRPFRCGGPSSVPAWRAAENPGHPWKCFYENMYFCLYTYMSVRMRVYIFFLPNPFF